MQAMAESDVENLIGPGMIHYEDERLDGWKSIARHLGRDRSTVIRWANERNLPVHSLPGGKSRTVYARKHELNTWMRSGGLDTESAGKAEAPATSGQQPVEQPVVAPVIDAPVALPIPSKIAFKRWWMAVALVCSAVIALAIVYQSGIAGRAETVRNESELPPAVQEQLLAARDDIASRSERRLDNAIVTLQAMRKRFPQHAGVHEALAEGYLLAREFGSLPDALALENARREASVTLLQNPDSATALRVIGVIAYWRDRNPGEAGKAFRRAIAAAPQDALAHQWYANILSDNGEDAAAFREFAAARQLNPGAPHLLADYAWALWSAGRVGEANAQLTDLVARYPNLASIHDCLSVIAFANGDHVGYERHLALRASARRAPELMTYARLVHKAIAQDNGTLYDIMLARGLAEAIALPDADHSWPAFIASVFGDREQLLAIMARARAGGEHWGASGYTRRIAQRWPADPAVSAALAGLRQPKIEEDAALQRFAT